MTEIIQNNDPELERLLAEEEAIEARTQPITLVEAENLRNGIEVLQRQVRELEDSLYSTRTELYDARQATNQAVHVALRDYKLMLANHVLDYDQGCIPGKRDFLRSLDIEWPLQKYEFKFTLPFRAGGLANYDYNQRMEILQRVKQVICDEFGVDSQYASYDYDVVEDED